MAGMTRYGLAMTMPVLGLGISVQGSQGQEGSSGFVQVGAGGKRKREIKEQAKNVQGKTSDVDKENKNRNHQDLKKEAAPQVIKLYIIDVKINFNIHIKSSNIRNLKMNAFFENWKK